MRALIITSKITFVPENYNRFICGLARHPEVVGVLELDNREPAILLKALGMMLTLSAPKMGLILTQNYFGSSSLERQMAYKNEGKFYQSIPSINSADTVSLIRDLNIDLIINARTRAFFKSEVLQAPRFGCINVHHGLLPEQRGLMCDFWAHLENEPYGFSIHQMTSKIDDGPLLHVQEVKSDRSCYMKSILKASEVEAEVCGNLISKIKADGKITPLNISANKVKYRKNPALTDGYKLQIKGIRI